MVYSTCSMNPMENESVVAELLRIGEGSLVLEDPRERMEGLIARPGWSSWKVLREDKGRTRRAMKDQKKKNNSKMMEKRKEWEEKVKNGECPPPKERQVETNDAEEEEKFVPSPYESLPYAAPATWDEAALRERTESLGFVEYDSFDDVEPDWRRRVRASCFPPTEEEAKEFQLHKSLRCLPQDMDTGGFFVALLKKVKPLSTQATEQMNAMTNESKDKDDKEVKKDDDKGEAAENDGDGVTTESSAAEPTEPVSTADDNVDDKSINNDDDEGQAPIQKAPRGKHGQKKKDLGNENFVHPDPALWPPIIEHFGLTASFPKEQYMCRASGESKVLYFISKSIKENLIDRGIQDRITVINSGLKGFERQNILRDCKMQYRVAQEGIHFLVPYMTKRLISTSMDDFHACIRTGLMNFDIFSEAFQKNIRALEPGSFVVALEGYEKDILKKMFLVMWRCHGEKLDCLVAKVEMDAIVVKMRALGYVAKETEAVVEKGVDTEKEVVKETLEAEDGVEDMDSSS